MCVCLQRKFGGLFGGGSSGGGGAVNEDSDDAASSGVKVRPTFGVSFGLPSGGGGSYPISPYGPNPSVNPYGHSLGGGNGLNLGLVSVNPLLSLQVSKDEFGEKIVKPWVNLHVTPNAGLVHKVGDIVHKLKAPHYGGGYGYGGHGYPSSYYHQHNHYHVPPPPAPYYPSHYGPSKPFYHPKPSYGGDYGFGGGYSSGGGGGYAPDYHSYRENDYEDDHGGYGATSPGEYYGQPDSDYDSGSFYRSSNATGTSGGVGVNDVGAGADNDYRGGAYSGGAQSSSAAAAGAGGPKVAFPNDRQSTGSVKFVGGQRRKRDVDEVKTKTAVPAVGPFLLVVMHLSTNTVAVLYKTKSTFQSSRRTRKTSLCVTKPNDNDLLVIHGFPPRGSVRKARSGRLPFDLAILNSL